MCGIFGVMVIDRSTVDHGKINSLLKDLFLLSETRGKEASGLAVNHKGVLHILKSSSAGSRLIRTPEFQDLMDIVSPGDNEVATDSFAIIGHSRLMTNGRNSLNKNNQPVNVNGVVGVHNGIIVNDDDIWKKLGQQPSSELDTEALIALLSHYFESEQSWEEAIGNSYSLIEGNASVAFTATDKVELCLATNNGSLYWCQAQEHGVYIFASEEYILKEVVSKNDFDYQKIHHIAPRNGLQIDQNGSRAFNFIPSNGTITASHPATRINIQQNARIVDHSIRDFPDPKLLRRCKKCILPETFPFISFDREGVCSICNAHIPSTQKNMEELRNQLAHYTNQQGKPDCLVGLSGGRDSCFGLHVVKNVLGMNPIAYTYDWGLVTDSARRNISRMCGKLGVEHILISADIPKKRANVRKNIHAWLKNPRLNMVPLFMAGDKQFYYYAHKLREQTGIELFLFCAGNELERTDFKIAFSGIRGNSGKGVLTQLGITNKLKLASNYALEFIRNPSYFNSSLVDSLWAFYSSYILKDDYIYLYHYYPWLEHEVEKTLFEEYGWEGATDTTTTWRVGDGTAAFYNYIYYAVAGFTEHDTFRSNQIRAGMLTREEALEKVSSENKPRWESLEQYAGTIGFNLDEALLRIHTMPRLYK